MATCFSSFVHAYIHIKAQPGIPCKNFLKTRQYLFFFLYTLNYIFFSIFFFHLVVLHYRKSAYSTNICTYIHMYMQGQLRVWPSYDVRLVAFQKMEGPQQFYAISKRRMGFYEELFNDRNTLRSVPLPTEGLPLFEKKCFFHLMLHMLPTVGFNSATSKIISDSIGNRLKASGFPCRVICVYVCVYVYEYVYTLSMIVVVLKNISTLLHAE